MLTQWIEALGRDRSILCATDQYFTPAAVVDAAVAIAQLVHEKAQGVFHLGGPRRVSRRELLSMVQSEYGKLDRPHATIKECSLRDIPVVEPRPLDTSLCSDKFTTCYGLHFRDVADIVQAAVRDCLHHRTDT
jgi:dTDP-4-dehydrorhamnose reductase